MTITETIKRYTHNNRMTAGYQVNLDGKPVFIGTFGECAEWGSKNLAAGAQWVVRDARGVVIG